MAHALADLPRRIHCVNMSAWFACGQVECESLSLHLQAVAHKEACCKLTKNEKKKKLDHCSSGDVTSSVSHENSSNGLSWEWLPMLRTYTICSTTQSHVSSMVTVLSCNKHTTWLISGGGRTWTSLCIKHCFLERSRSAARMCQIRSPYVVHFSSL